MTASALPRNFSLSMSVDITTTTRINRFIEMENEDIASHGFLIAKGDHILNPFSMLEPVSASSGRVHLRCYYNNKYLSIQSGTDHRITPEANEKVEDKSSWKCTLFTLTTNQSTGRTRVEHVHLERRLVALEPDRILVIDQDDQAAEFDDFAVHNVSAILALNLPPFFTLKDIRGNYGEAYPDDVIGFMEPVNNFNPNLMYEILPFDVGLIRIRSVTYGTCWRSHRYQDEESKIILVNTSADLANLPADHTWSDGFFNIEWIRDAGDNVVYLRHVEFGIPMCRDGARIFS